MMEPYDSEFAKKRLHKGGYTDIDIILFHHEWIQACAKICPDSVCGRLAKEDQENFDHFLQGMTPRQREVFLGMRKGSKAR